MIDRQLEHVIKHARYEYFEYLGALFDARICVDFNQPCVEILIQYEIVAEQLEAASPLLRVQDLPSCQHRTHNQTLHCLHYVVLHRICKAVVVKVVLELGVRHLVAVFEDAVGL